MANMRYRHFGVQAEKEDYSNVSCLFSAIQHAEYIHVQVCEVCGYTLGKRCTA
ncbi:MAG: hypothetical protein JW932_06045 [Deltaproteobacteria bacterium]|nr:hypothetical protein [Deltaproteobacteria bacterium]